MHVIFKQREYKCIFKILSRATATTGKLSIADLFSYKQELRRTYTDRNVNEEEEEEKGNGEWE